MTPYLIAHIVRGQPAFDIAERMECPECHPGYDLPATHFCDECDNLGYWWILSTCGYRARPWKFYKLNSQGLNQFISEPLECPQGWPDLFAINNKSHKPIPEQGNDLLQKLGLLKKSEPIRRRV